MKIEHWFIRNFKPPVGSSWPFTHH